MNTENTVLLCPGQGAQQVGMGRRWHDESPAAAAVFAEADEIMRPRLGAKLSEICFKGPQDVLNRTDVAQPALYVCSVACYRGLVEKAGAFPFTVAAGLSLGEYTALHLAGAFDFADGLGVVIQRGELMQKAAQKTAGGMVALIGADDEQAEALCASAAQGGVLVCANYNAPGQIVLSGDDAACVRATTQAGEMGLRASRLTVAGAFHSPLMERAVKPMSKALAALEMRPLTAEVWSNVTGEPHDPENTELLRQRLVEQIVRPVRWAQTCRSLAESGTIAHWAELAPGTVLKGLMRRIERSVKVTSYEEPELVASPGSTD